MFSTEMKFKDAALFIARLGIGLSYMFVHGSKKLFGGPERWERIGGAMGNFGIDFYPIFWGFMASFAEFVGGLLLVLGLLFRPAAFLILVTMLVASFRHFSNGDPVGKIAYPLELGFVMILFMLIGPGKYSIDEFISKRMRRKR